MTRLAHVCRRCLFSLWQAPPPMSLTPTPSSSFRLQPALYDIVDVFCDSKSHNPNAKLHHLAAVIFNATQVSVFFSAPSPLAPRGVYAVTLTHLSPLVCRRPPHPHGPQRRRLHFAGTSRVCLFISTRPLTCRFSALVHATPQQMTFDSPQRLLPFTQFGESTLRRGGIVGALRNCCFDSTVSPLSCARALSAVLHARPARCALVLAQTPCLPWQDHEWLMGNEVDILPHLLLPLAGPEELDEEVGRAQRVCSCSSQTVPFALLIPSLLPFRTWTACRTTCSTFRPTRSAPCPSALRPKNCFQVCRLVSLCLFGS